MKKLREFVQFKEPDFVVVRLEDLGKLTDLTVMDVAKAIVAASNEGEKPVNFRLGSQVEYWNNWTHHGNGAVIDAALEHLGYFATFQTNPTSDGRYYILEKKSEVLHTAA